MPVDNLAVAPIAVLGAGVLIQVLLSRTLTGRGKGWAAVTATVVAAATTAAWWPHLHRGGTYDLRLGSWDGPVTLTFHADGLSLLFALMATGIGTAILLYSVGYLAADAAATRFYVLMQIFIAGLVLLVLAADLLLMYAAWEIVGLCSFLLVGFWYTDREAAAGARKVLVMTHGAGYALLAAILLLYARTGTTLWTDPRVAESFSTGVFTLMLIAAAAKSVQFPLHTWIPSAMAAPTPVSALLHAAVYVKAGVYLVARMHSIAPWPHTWQVAVVTLGAVSMLIGVLFAMVQQDAKRMLAFSTVSQIGYMMLGLGLGTPLGVAAALLHTLNHGLFKGGLFLGAGAVQHATGTRDLDRLGGLSRRMPATTALWLTSSAGISGIPLFNGFVSKLLLYIAALQAGFTTAALVAWVTSILTLFTFLRATSAMFFGEDGPASPQAQESPRVMLAGSALLGASCLVLGIAPQLALDPLIVPALAGMGLSGDLGVGWFGFVASGDIAVAAGLGLAVLSVVLGYALHRTMARTAPVPATAAAHTTTWAPRELVSVGPAADALPPVGRGTRFTGAGSPFTGGEPHLATGYPRAGDFSRTIATGLAPIYTGADPDRYYRMLWHGLLRVTEHVGRGSAWLERRAIAALAAATVLIGVVAAVFAGVTRPDSAGYDGGSGHTGAVPWPFLTAVALALLSLLLALADGAGPRRGLTPAALTGVTVLAGLVSTAELPRLLLFEVAAFGAVVALTRSGVTAPARNAYLAAAILSAGALLAGTLLRESGPAWLVLALLLTGFAVKFALVPAYLWLPVLAARAPAALVGFVIAVVDLAAFAELADLRRSAGWLFTPRWPWLTLALLTIGAGGLLALADRDLKRVLAFTAVSASGLLLLGVGGPGPFAADGARALAAADALAAALLFGAVAAAERDRWAPDLASRGLARRHPLAAAAFVAGSLTALGVPFTAGFTGHWRLYATALDAGWPALVLLIGTTLALLLAHARIIAVVWWGGPEGTAPLPPDRPRARTVWRDEPPRHTLALVFLLFGATAAGFFPVLLLAGGA